MFRKGDDFSKSALAVFLRPQTLYRRRIRCEEDMWDYRFPCVKCSALTPVKTSEN